ncbi:PD-(D/E)XK nuclease family protein [Tissierella praeacuta]|jgi:hypothetical protein|uniref:PDDEXK-like family protein n=1 Tax=Tissierella praeacuta TaxID=43131 RepID=UPI002FD967E3
MNIELLLHEISAISKKHDLINQKTGGYFNIFKITNIASDEVTICRVLYELLSPSGSHYQGTTYLKIFIEEVLKIEMSESELGSATVYREPWIDGNRRIDIVIRTKERFIPIEVKIYAEDQKNQCYDYYQKAINSNLFYLTRFGDLPSEYSTNGLTDKEITAISFSDDILKWLENCLEQKETIKIAPIREVILQFMSAIRSFTNQMEDEKEMEIKDVIMKSPVNMRSAIAIESSVTECKRDLMGNFFKTIEEKVDRKKLENEYDYAANEGEKVNKFYSLKNSTCPGISYLYKTDVKPNIDIWVRIEIEDFIFVGYCVANCQKWEKQSLSEGEIMNHIKWIDKPEIDNWWAYYEYLPDDNSDETPDFRNANEYYLNLFSKEEFDSFVDICVNKINEFLLK